MARTPRGVVFMPDDLIPPTAEPSAEPQAESTPTSETPQESTEDAYDDGLEALLSEDTGTAEEPPSTTPDDAAAPTETTDETDTNEPPADADKVFVTVSEQRVLERAGLAPEFYEGWSREQVEKYVEKAGKIQRDADQASAELGRLKQPKPDDKPKDEPKVELTKQVADAIKGLSEVYDEETVKPFGDVLTQLVQGHSQSQARLNETVEMLGSVAPLMQLVSEMAIETTLSGLKSEFPSLDKPDARKQAIDRFWIEWKTGAYAKDGTPILDQIREAANNAVRVTFMNTTEQTAAATLVSKNRDRVASQPRRGPTKAPPKPRTEEDIYDESYAEIMAKAD